MPVTDREHVPLAVYEAYNAQRIAQQVGADKYAPDIMQEVQTDLQNAQAIQDGKHRDVKMEFTTAREAVQRAEDARITSLRKQDEQHQQQAQDAKQAAQMQAQEAQADADRAAAQKAQADAARARAEADAANARAQAAASQQQAQQSKESEEATREKLREQLNSVLQTTDTARGLVMNLGDVLFDTNKYTLKPNAQVSLAKVATILTLYPNLKVQVEGYTDSTGTPTYNQTLSENRAGSVRNFLVQNGVQQGGVSAQGYGATNFVADNGSSSGRQQNRRVNLVVSGASIGVQTTDPGQPGAAAAAVPPAAPRPQNPTGVSNPQ
jgi:outer membrane protein OmpA-like peptidoglycan-associated protein